MVLLLCTFDGVGALVGVGVAVGSNVGVGFAVTILYMPLTLAVGKTVGAKVGACVGVGDCKFIGCTIGVPLIITFALSTFWISPGVPLMLI